MGRWDKHYCQVNCGHSDVPVGQVYHVHHPEHERQPAGEKGEQATEQDPCTKALTTVIS